MYHNKVVWITGASSGIGEAVAIEMAKSGARLILSARRELELERVATLAGEAGAPDVLVLPFDITDEARFPDLVRQVTDRFGRIDLLFNNAGISQRSRCIDTEMRTYRHLFEVDVFGQIALTKQVLPVMISQKSGHIAVTSSVAGKVGVSSRTAYCAAKHAIMGFFDALRTEVGPDNIRVTCITPGFIKTDISLNAVKGDGSSYAKMDDDIMAGMDVTRAARIIVRGLAKGRPEIVVSQLPERAALLIKRLWPSLLFRIMAKKAGQERY